MENMKGKTKDFFIPGKMSVLLDGNAGSSGKGILATYLIQNAGKRLGFVCNTFSPNASHTIKHEGSDEEIVYKQLNSCAHLHHLFEKMYIGHGSTINLEALQKELEITKLPTEKLGISPTAVIVQGKDQAYERGELGFDGEEKKEKHAGTMKTGTTASGSGAARAKKVLRRPSVVYARDIEALRPYICNVENEIMDRLERNQTGLLEIAQGFPLSYGLAEFAPYTTSRNCTVSAGLDDMLLPTSVVGNVVINFRTFPIKIHSKKYIGKGTEYIKVEGDDFEEISSNATLPDGIDNSLHLYIENTLKDQVMNAYVEKYKPEAPTKDIPLIYSVSGTDDGKRQIKFIVDEGRHMFWGEVQANIIPFETIESYSGDFYEDQKELTWDDITHISGSNAPIMECTTLTKLPRRVATFSKRNLHDAIRYNQTVNKVWISVNFMNYVDGTVYGYKDSMTSKLTRWIEDNIIPVISKFDNVQLRVLGTGPNVEDKILLK